MDGGDSNELIKLDIQGETRGLPSAIEELDKLNKKLVSVEATLQKVAGNKGMEKVWGGQADKIRSEIAALEKLNQELVGIADKFTQTVKSQNAANASTKAMTASIDAQKKAWAANTAAMQKSLAGSKAATSSANMAKQMSANITAARQQAAANAKIAATEKRVADEAWKHGQFRAKLSEEIRRNTKEVASFTRGFDTSTQEGKSKFSAWKKGVDDLGVSIMGSAKSVNMARGNMKKFTDAAGNIKKVGVANLATIDALEEGTASAFTRGITNGEKFRIQMGMIKRDAHSLFESLGNQATRTQWLGRQMLQGITLPVIAFGTMAVSAFDKVNSSFLQLKKVLQFKGDFEGMKKDIRNVAHEFGLTDAAVTMLYEDVAAMGVRGNAEIKKWAEGISQISKLGDVDLADATKLFRVMNATFSDGSVEDTVKIMAELNAVVDDSSIRLKDLVEVIPTASPVMKTMGFDAAGTAIALTSMYKKGIDASVSAHALNAGMQRFAVPTKQATQMINELGVGFFNTNGQITDADKNFALLAETFNSYNPQDKLEIAKKTFGMHHAQKFIAMFEDMGEGIEELRRANEDGKITLEETDAFITDYARTMVGAGKVAADGLVDPVKRYNDAWAQFRDDPSVQLDRLKGDLRGIMVEVGAVIIDPLLAMGEQIKGFFDMLAGMPTFVKRGFGILILAAAALGPIIYSFAQLEQSIASFGKMATAILPKAFKDITELDARQLLEADPSRTDIKQVGSRFLQVDEGKKGPKGSALVTTESLTRAEKDLTEATVISTAATDKQGDEMSDLTIKSRLVGEEIERLDKKIDKATRSQAELALMNETGTTNMGQIGQPQTNNSAALERRKKELDLDIAEGKKAVEKKKKYWHLFGTQSGDGFVKGFGTKMKGIKGAMGQKLSLKHWLNFGEAVDGNKSLSKLSETFKLVKGDSTGLMATLKGLFSVFTSGGGMAASALMGVAGSLGTVILIAGPVIAALGGLIWFVMEAKKHFAEIKIAAEPGFKAIGNAIQYVKDALSEVGQKFMGVINQLSGGGEGDQAVSFWQQFGAIVGSVAEFVAKGIKLIGDGIKAAWPLIEGIAYSVKDVIGVVVSLINGEWATAFQYLAAYAWEGIRPVAGAFELLSNIALWAVKAVISGFEWLSKGLESALDMVGITTTAFSGFFASLGDGVQKMADFNLVDYMDNQMRNLAPVFNGGIAKAIPEGDEPVVQDAAQELGQELGNSIAEETGDAAAKKMAEDDWFKDFLSAVRSRIDAGIQELVQAAQKAMEAAHDAEMKVYDDKLKKMDDIEEAEDRLYATQAYLEKKREMLYQRSINTQNYQRDRALAIYEGRVDDARMLDLQQTRDTHDFNKDMSSLETERGKELLAQAREDMRKRIEEEKAAAEERYSIAKEAFDKQLELITEYTPRTVEEYNKMMQDINALLQKNGVEGWPEMAKTGGDRMFDAIHKANEDIRQDFAWSGEAAVTAWIAAFADADVIAILRQKLKDASDELSSGPTGVPSSDGSAPEGVPYTDVAPMDSPEIAEPPAAEPIGLDAPSFSIDGMVQDFKMGVDRIKQFFSDLWTIGWGGAQAFWKLIKDKAEGAWSFVSDVWGSFSGFFSGLWEDIQGIWGGISEWFSGIWATVSETFASAWNGIGTTIQDVWSNIIQPIWDGIQAAWENQLSPIFQLIGSVFQTVWWAIGQGLSFVWNSIIQPIWNSIGGWITGSMIPWFQGLWTKVSEVWDGISGAIGGAWNWLQPIFQSIQGWIQNTLIPIFNSLWQTVQGAWTNITNAVSNAWNWIKPIFQSVWDWITGSLYNAWTWISVGAQNAFNGLIGFLKNTWNTITSGIANGINWLIDRFNQMINMWNKVPGHDPVGTMQPISIPTFQMASGGFVTNGVSSIVGEGNRPEFVIPTDPRYRENALQLTGQLVQQLGAGRTPSTNGGSIAKTATNVAGAVAEGSSTTIYVETFIGEEAWFNKMAETYDVKVGKKKATASGSQRRVVGSYNENQRGGFQKK